MCHIRRLTLVGAPTLDYTQRQQAPSRGKPGPAIGCTYVHVLYLHAKQHGLAFSNKVPLFTTICVSKDCLIIFGFLGLCAS
jgi:hypothetical protein